MSKLSQLKVKINTMNKHKALKTLEEYQAWRRGADTEMLDSYIVGEAIDEAILTIKEWIKNDQRAKVSRAYPG